jgi:hypothetical protein
MNQNSIVLLVKPAWQFLIVNALVLCLSSRAVAAEEGGLPVMSTETIVASVTGNNLQAFEKVASDLYAERQRLFRELLRILQDTNSSNFQKCSAAYFLGEVRIPDPVAALATHVTLRKEASGSTTRLPVIRDYPAMEALIKIGKPSTKHMVQNLEDSSDLLTRELSARVISVIEGRSLAGIIIGKAISKQPDPVKKKRLKAALSLRYLTETK